MNLVDDSSFMIRLKMLQLMLLRLRSCFEPFHDFIQRFRSVDFGLPLSQQVQVWSVDDKNLHNRYAKDSMIS